MTAYVQTLTLNRHRTSGPSALMVVLLAVLCGCGGVELRSDPAGASVYLNEHLLGATPRKVSLGVAGGELLFVARKEGYQDTTYAHQAGHFPFRSLPSRIFFQLVPRPTPGHPSPRPPPKHLVAPPGQGIGLVIGIDDYAVMGDLGGCRGDAERVARMLVEDGGYCEDRVVVLTDRASEDKDKPTYANLLRRIPQACELAGQSDVLLIYFAGHGITSDGDAYLVPMDGGDKQTSIPLAWVQQQMQEETCTAKSKVLILDTCRPSKGTRGILDIEPSIRCGPNLVVITSCSRGEYSNEEGTQGVFTGFLVNGLAGSADANRDGQVSAGEIFPFVKDRMEKWQLKSGLTQHPQMFPADAIAVMTTVPKEQE